MQVVGSKR